MDSSIPWINRRETHGHNISRPATSPGDIEGQSQPTETINMSTRHTSPEITSHNTILPGRLGIGLRESSAQTERFRRFDANVNNNMTLAMPDHAVLSPGVGSSSPYPPLSPVLYSNPRSSASNTSSPRSASGAPLPVYHYTPGCGGPVQAGQLPEASGHAARPANDIIDDTNGGCAPSSTIASSPVATRPACTFYHAASPLILSSLSSQRGQPSSTFKYNEGTSSPNHLRRYHQASSSSPASCGTFSTFDRTSFPSPHDRSSTMSAASHSRSSSTVTMLTGDNLGPQGNDTTGLPVDQDKGKGKEVTPPLPSSSRDDSAALPSMLSSSEGVRKYGKGPASSSGSSGDLAERFLPGGIFTPSPHKVARRPVFSGAAGPSRVGDVGAGASASPFAGPFFGQFAGQFPGFNTGPSPAPPAATTADADGEGLAGASVDERYAPMHTGEQGRIDASMRPIEHEAASWTTSEAFKILEETVPAEYQATPGFGWAISEVVRLAEGRAKAKYGLPDHQTAAIKQYNVPFAGNLPPFEGYLLWRGDGQYTRLIPADTLPPLKGIPATQTNKVGYWVCPPPNAAGEKGWAYQQPVELVEQYPATRPASHQGVSDEDLQFAANYFGFPLPRGQSRIDSIVATTTSPTSVTPGPSRQPKRVKVYCDKWIHDGTCAFTQQGCKYKHEMPHDRATQHALGLFHGYPAWWKRQQAELARQKPAAATTPTTAPTTPTATAPAMAGSPGPSDGVPAPVRRAAVAGSWRSGSVPERAIQTSQHASPFGPIGPPAATPKRRLEAVKEGEEDDEA